MRVEDLEEQLPFVGPAVKHKPNVVGYGIGYKRVDGKTTDTLCFIVFVERKLRGLAPADAVAEAIRGVPTDVVESGPLAPGANDGEYRPIPAGVEISVRGASGTLGCYLRNESYPGLFMLSNNHVLARYGTMRAGSDVFQRGGPVARLFRFPWLGDLAEVDCAVARMTTVGSDGGSPDATPALMDYLGTPTPIANWIGSETADVAVAYGRVTPGTALRDGVVFHVNAAQGANMGYLRVIPSTGESTNAEAVGGWFGNETQAAGLVILDANGDAQPDVILFFMDHGAAGNRGVLRVGYSLGPDAKCSRFDSPIVGDGWWGTQTAGGGIAVADLTGTGSLDLVAFFIDAPAGENRGCLRIWRNFVASAAQPSWQPHVALPGQWGAETQGADITYLGRDASSGQHEFLLAQIDNPGGENSVWYRILVLDVDGGVARILGPYSAAGWVGAQSQGLGVASAGPSRITFATVDNPSGENRLYLRTASFIPDTSTTRLRRLGARLSGTAPVYLGQHLWKSGRTSQVTHATVTAVSASILTKGTPGLIGDYWTGRNIVLEPCTTKAGDSGSVFLDRDGQVVALHHTGDVDKESKVSAGSNIGFVFDNLRLSSPYRIPGWVGAETLGGSIASAPDRGLGTDLVLVHVNRAPNGGVGYYRVGFGLDTNGQVSTTRQWSSPRPVDGWRPHPSQSVGVAVANLRGYPIDPCVVVLRVDHAPSGVNGAWLHIGLGLRADGVVGDGWVAAPVENWRDGACQGVDIAVADLEGTGKMDVVVLHIENAPGENSGWYRVGKNLGPDGTIDEWRDWMRIPHAWGADTGGAGVAITNLDDDPRPEIVVFHVDNASGSNMGYYRIGWNVDRNGFTSTWSAPQQFGQWWGSRTAGAGLTVAEITENERPELIAMHIDDPPGENAAYYRVLYDMMPNGMPALWSVAG